jgi:hypothetical protein
MHGRDNGFVARHYVPLADLDPRLADAMLDVLRSESIAAYVEPSTGLLGGYLEVHLPERPRDRLWVDQERRDRAAVLLSEQTAESAKTGADDAAQPPLSDAASLDDVWAQLVADFDRPADGVTNWPASEDLPDAAASDQDPLPFDDAGSDASPVRRRIVRRADRDGSAPAEPSPAEPTPAVPVSGEWDPLSILDEHFVPPTPPRPPAMRPATKAAVTAIVAGFALIIVKAFIELPGAIALGVVGIVGGFIALVAGMRPDRSPDEDEDDGAVV